ncbi:MAG TPA: hypothetical protein VK400_05990 [Pyrinomonadaceae bacterium]|nr:hypothetical protein [Pyrinomonadaceae bacterium]
MIKSLFDYDEEDAGAKPQPDEAKTETAETEDSIKRQLEDLNLSPEMQSTAASTMPTDDETETITQIRQPQSSVSYGLYDDAADDDIETIALPKIERVYTDGGEPTPLDNVFSENQLFESESEKQATESEPPPRPMPLPEASPPMPYRNVLQSENAFQNANAPASESVSAAAENVSRSEPQSLTTAETIRQSGMAWSAAVGLFGSVLFMMILGWFFDLLTGASPFGIVAGIIIGAGIGFYQFFRTTSQIFKKD